MNDEQQDPGAASTAYCMTCSNEIPEARQAKKSTTCSKVCQKRRDVYLRERTALKRCRYCSKPTTPEQRVQFRRLAQLQRLVRGATAIPQLVEALPQIERQMAAAGTPIESKQLARILAAILDTSAPPIAPAEPGEEHEEEMEHAEV